MKMKILMTAVFLAAAWGGRAATNDLTSLLQQGLFDEEANHDLPSAISDYQSLATQFDRDRQVAATAIYRLGECYRKMGETNEAVSEYQRILKEFSEQKDLVMLSQQNLKGLGLGSGNQFQQRLDQIVAHAALDAKAPAPATDPEDQEIARIQDMIKNSPDLINGPNGELAKAANSGELRVAAFLLDHGADINGNGGELPLVSAAVNAQKSMVELLLNRGADVNGRNKDGGTALLGAARRGFQSVVDVLLAHKADPNESFAPPDNGSGTPLHVAAEHGFANIIESLLKAGANPNSVTAQGRTPLSYAAARDSVDSLKLLLAAKADPNAGAFDLPLLNAVRHGNHEGAELLLQAGADPDSTGKIDENFMNHVGPFVPLRMAILLNDAGMVQLLLKYKADPGNAPGTVWAPLFDSLGYTNILAALLGAHANPNVVDRDGRTPLSLAAENGQSVSVKLLLAAKADPNGGTMDAPLLAAIVRVASQTNDLGSAEALLQAGADPNKFSQINWSVQIGNNHLMGAPATVTPLWLSVYYQQLPMVRLLLKYKVDPNDQQTGRKPVVFDALVNPPILDALLTAGANADVRDHEQIHPVPGLPFNRTDEDLPLLHSAVATRNDEAVAVLLKHGANPNSIDGMGKTPLHLAVEALADKRMFELLLAAKANPNVLNKDGQTPLDLLKEEARTQPGNWFAGQNLNADQVALALNLADLLRQHGALDQLPDWQAIRVSRSGSGNFPEVFKQRTNEWNHFSLLELINRFNLCFGAGATSKFAFADLAHVTVARPNRNGGPAALMEVNLLNDTNGIDFAKDVNLEFGDVVEFPEREHTLAENGSFLTDSQGSAIRSYFEARAGTATLIVDGGATVQLRLQSLYSELGRVLGSNEAKAVLRSDSDLSRVKITRHNPQPGKTEEWTIDCGVMDQNYSIYRDAPDLWLRNQDVIEVPKK